ncbi:helix-turn-helix domain-containing protein, partial [Candidatus Parcubacteria bacterium]
MGAPIFVRPLTAEEQQTLQAGLRSSDAFVLRRCPIILASAQGKPAKEIAGMLGWSHETVRLVIHRFNAQGLAVRQAGSCRPHRTLAAFDAAGVERLKD